MASAEQLKALLKSFIDDDDPHFMAVAMQVAAHEAKLGHGKLAQELRDLIDEAKIRKSGNLQSRKLIPIAQPRGELSSLLSVIYPKQRLSDMVLDEHIQNRIERLIKEYRQLARLRAHGLGPRRKLLLIGPPGTGKTMTARAIAGELGLPQFEVRLDSLITKFMGETASKLRLIFDSLAQVRGVYLFDEFDSIGFKRTSNNDVGEIRRVLNSFLQLIEQDNSDSIIIAATNHVEVLDRALFRRFDDVIEFTIPDAQLIISLFKNRLAGFAKPNLAWSRLAEAGQGFSYADWARASEDAIKDAIIHDRRQVDEDDVIKMLHERMAYRQS